MMKWSHRAAGGSAAQAIFIMFRLTPHVLHAFCVIMRSVFYVMKAYLFPLCISKGGLTALMNAADIKTVVICDSSAAAYAAPMTLLPRLFIRRDAEILQQSYVRRSHFTGSFRLFPVFSSDMLWCAEERMGPPAVCRSISTSLTSL